MRKIITVFALICSISLFANPTKNDSLKNDSLNISSIQRESDISETQNAYSLADNEINKIADKVVEKMKQEGNKKVIIILNGILRWIAIGILVLILIFLSTIVWGCYKIYKKLMNIERNHEDDKRKESFQAANYRRYPTEEKIDKIAKNIEEIKSKVISDSKEALKGAVVQKNVVEDIKDTHDISQRKESKAIYAKPLQDDFLKTTEEMEAIYIISVKKDATVAKFRIYEKEEQMLRAIRNKEYILEHFCDTTGSSINAKAIKNVSDGEVEQMQNGVWKVIKKAEIEFIK